MPGSWQVWPQLLQNCKAPTSGAALGLAMQGPQEPEESTPKVPKECLQRGCLPSVAGQQGAGGCRTFSRQCTSQSGHRGRLSGPHVMGEGGLTRLYPWGPRSTGPPAASLEPTDHPTPRVATLRARCPRQHCGSGRRLSGAPEAHRATPHLCVL